MKKTILITAGEASGDIHAANLVNALKKTNSELSFYGIGGGKMLGQGVDILERMEKLSIIGVSEIFAKLGEIRRTYKKIMDKVKDSPPDLVILVDYPGFNLTLAKALKKRGLKIVYYITPQVWAWGKFRIKLIKKCIDKAIVILKFEESLFRQYGIDATFVGHPLLDRESRGIPLNRESLGLKRDVFTIALLPGSRETEVKNMLPLMLKAGHLIRTKKNVQFVLLKSSTVDENTYGKILESSKLPLAGVKDNTYGCLTLADFVFTSSGTATLESALMEKPMLIMYKTSLLTGILFRIFARTPFIGLVNIISKRLIAPEILQYDASPKRLAREILSIITSKETLDGQVRALREVKRVLGTPGAATRAANIVDSFLES